MYLSKKVAKELNPEIVAELATEYCNSFVRALGSYKSIAVEPGRICTSLDELRNAYKEKRGRNELSDNIKETILNFGAFYDRDIIYTPLVKVGKLWSLDGFYNEMGHLVGHELYGPKMDNYHGLGEALDHASSLYGLFYDCRKRKVKLEQIERLIENRIEFYRDIDKVNDVYMLYGQRPAEKLVKKYFDDKDIETFRTDFLKARHYEGLKIFLTAYDKANGNLERTLWLLHKTMINPDVRDPYDALRYLGWDKDKLERYKPFLFNKSKLRKAIINYVEKI